MATRNTSDRAVVAAFHSHAEAQQAVHDLKKAGFSDEQIGIATQDREGTYQEQMDDNHAGEGAAIGATAGLGAGALWGLGIVAGVLPAIGPVIAGGALAAVVASAAGTAAAGGVVGALIGLGIPEDEAEYYHEEFEQGRTIVTVRTNTAASAVDAKRILDRYNAYDFSRRQSEFATNPETSERLDYERRPVPRRDIAETGR